MVAFENTPLNKNMFKVDDTRATSVNVIWVSLPPGCDAGLIYEWQ